MAFLVKIVVPRDVVVMTIVRYIAARMIVVVAGIMPTVMALVVPGATVIGLIAMPRNTICVPIAAAVVGGVSRG